MVDGELGAITIRGFRSIREIDSFELQSINVLIGANGSGKSNVLGIFTFLRAVQEGRMQDYVARQGGAERILHFGARQTPRLEIELSFCIDEVLRNTYRIELQPTADDRLYPSEEWAGFWNPDEYDAPREEELPDAPRGEAGISASDLTKIARWVHRRLGMWTTFHFHDTSVSAPLRRTARLNDNRRLRPDGSNLPAFLYLLRERHAGAYQAIRRAVRRVTPFFDDFVLEPLALSPDSIRLEWRHQGSDQHFDVASLSDGSLRFIALATLLLQPEELRPSIILVDEPELGLHPSAITMLGSLVRMAAEGAQVILSTQSSLLLDQFEPEDVIVAERHDMATTLRRLDPEPLRKEYSLGQLWEKNELGGRPSGGASSRCLAGSTAG